MSFYGTDINDAFNTLDSRFELQAPAQAQYQAQAQMSTPISKLPPAPLPMQPQPQQLQIQQQQQAPPPQPKPAPALVPPTKRREIIKFVTYALVILFALSLYSVFELIIKEIVVGNDLGYKQEIGMRFVYPILIFVVLWNIRSLIQ
jgi:hypothetical protein